MILSLSVEWLKLPSEDIDSSLASSSPSRAVLFYSLERRDWFKGLKSAHHSFKSSRVGERSSNWASQVVDWTEGGGEAEDDFIVRWEGVGNHITELDGGEGDVFPTQPTGVGSLDSPYPS